MRKIQRKMIAPHPSLTRATARVRWPNMDGPRWDLLAQAFVRRRQEIAQDMGRRLETAQALRNVTTDLDPDVLPSSTLRTLEEEGAKDWRTIVPALQMYQMGLYEFLGTLFPELDREYNRSAELLAEKPWLKSVVDRLASSPPSVKRFILQGLGLPGAAGVTEEEASIGDSA